jgi:hypothetical protein
MRWKRSEAVSCLQRALSWILSTLLFPELARRAFVGWQPNSRISSTETPTGAMTIASSRAQERFSAFC